MMMTCFRDVFFSPPPSSSPSSTNNDNDDDDVQIKNGVYFAKIEIHYGFDQQLTYFQLYVSIDVDVPEIG